MRRIWKLLGLLFWATAYNAAHQWAPYLELICGIAAVYFTLGLLDVPWRIEIGDWDDEEEL